MSYIQNKLDEFDKQFGKAGDNRNCDSIGRWAGCDDCEGNIGLRDEHRKFIEQSLTDYHNHIVEKVNKDLFDEWEAVTEIDNPISINHMRKDFNSLLQDTNPKE